MIDRVRELIAALQRGMDVDGTPSVADVEAVLAHAAADCGLARPFAPRLTRWPGPRRLSSLARDVCGATDDATRLAVAASWLEEELEGWFGRILEAFRLHPDSQQAADALLRVVQSDLLPRCRSLAWRNPSFLAEGDGGTTDDLAREALQGFFVHLLAGDRRALIGFRGASRTEFRAWLLIAFNNHRRSRLRSQNRDRRGGRAVHVGAELLTELGHELRDGRSADIASTVDARQGLQRVREELDAIRAEGGKADRDVNIFLGAVEGASVQELLNELGEESSLTASGISKAVGRIRSRIRWALGKGDE